MHRSVWLPVLLAVTSSCAPSPPDLVPSDGWARATGQSTIAAVYLTIANRGGEPDWLVSVRSERGVATLHRTDTTGGIARMIPVSEREGLNVPADGQLTFAPGGAHVMLSGLEAPLRQGERFTMTLVFQRSSPKSLTIVVREAGADHGGH